VTIPSLRLQGVFTAENGRWRVTAEGEFEDGKRGLNAVQCDSRMKQRLPSSVEEGTGKKRYAQAIFFNQGRLRYWGQVLRFAGVRAFIRCKHRLHQTASHHPRFQKCSAFLKTTPPRLRRGSCKTQNDPDFVKYRASSFNHRCG